MEAVPRLPMISFLLKVSPEPAIFGPTLKQYIRDFYHEDPESYTNEIAQLESLRAAAVRPPIEMAGCVLLKTYYCQLHFLQSRFPMGKDSPAAVTFTWRDTYANMVCSLASIRFEMISVLYNIGAMHTQLGARTKRTSADGMKIACAHFQCAAWAFEHLKNSYPQPSGVDLAPELMTFMYQLCLAQAQECILEKSMLDNRKPTIVAKVAKQIVDYFNLALKTLKHGGSEEGTVSDTVGTKIYKSWKRYVKFKKAYHVAVTCLYQGLAAEEQRKMGERVAFYNIALEFLNEARSIYNNAKGVVGITGAPEEKTIVEEALTFTNDVIEGKRKAAKNENEFIYHEEVPERTALPAIKGASLVKGISFNINDPEVSGKDIFARLVPMKVHEASSLYSEEKAKLLRQVGSNIEEKDEQLMMYMASLKLENLCLWEPDPQTPEWERLPVPKGLVERCAALNARPQAIQELVDIMGKLSETSQGVESILKEIENLLNEEELKEKQYQDTVGKRPPSIVATDLTREAKKYIEAHNKALESNQALEKAIAMHVKNLKVLAQPLFDLIAHIPSPAMYFLEQNSERSQGEVELEKVRIKELKHILSTVDRMRKQRSELHEKLRESIAQDDLTRLLVTATSESGPLDRLFADQLKKHEALVNLIDQNLAAQENILAALTDAYAQTTEIRKGVDEIMKRREQMISALIVSYDTYEDLLAKSTKGLEFYRKLEINVSKLLQRVKSTCKVQEEEREQILAQENKNTYKPEVSTALAYDQSNVRTGGNLKLKDYLNNRTDHVPAHQYYNVYKGHADSADSYAASKSFASDVAVQPTNVQSVPAATFRATATEPPYANYKPDQQYYSGYIDPNISSPYYDPQSSYYGQNVNPSFSQNYTRNNTSDTAAHSSTGTPETAANVPQRYFKPTEQTVPAAMPNHSDKQFSTAQPLYNYGNTMQYNAYQPSADYNKPAVEQQDHTYGVANQGYDVSKTEAAELTSQIQSMSLNTVAGATGAAVGTASGTVPGTASGITNASTADGLSIQSVAQGQEYLTTNQGASHTVQPNFSTDPTMMQNYQVPMSDVASNVAPTQNYASASYGLPVNQEQIPGNYGMYTTTNATPQYMQTQTTATSTYSTHVVSSVDATNMSASAIPTSTPTLQSGTDRYVQQQQQQQDYAGKTYLPYSVPTQETGANLSYPNTYQNYQYTSGGLPYQQNVTMASGVSGNYASTSYPVDNEIIQSHTRSATIPNYQQPYQSYPTQSHYSSYMTGTNYSQEYNRNYNYEQTDQSAGAAAQPYHSQTISQDQSNDQQNHPMYSTGSQPGNYTYNTSPSTSLVPPASTSYGLASQTNSTAYQQQETNARYTNASNNVLISQTPSSQYQNQVYEPQTSNGTYYTMPYGLQMQNQGVTVKQDNQNAYNQTYMQAVNNGTNTTTSADPTKLTSTPQEQKSNVDLLSDLDITINHAPLVPEVRPLKQQDQKEEQKEETAKSESREDSIKEEQNEITDTEITATVSSLSEDKIEAENLQIVWDTWYNDVQPKKDPLGDPTTLQKFVTDVEKYEKFIDGLLVKTLSGATNLDIRWKEVQIFEERENGKQSSTVALAHSSDNRSNDCIPYDTTRVQLSSSDLGTSYINASHITEITQWIPTAFIITQAPTPDKFHIFWTMIWEQESEVIACLASDTQLNGEIYWPISEDGDLNIGNFTISLKKTLKHPSYIQRVVSIRNNKTKTEKVAVHMQFLAWPSNGFPSSPGPLLTFSTDVLTEQALRRCSPKPVVIHCTNGGSLSSLFLVAAATVCHIRAGCGIVDVPLVFKGLIKCRKQVVNKESLLFAYRMVLYHAQDILMKRGILSSTRSTFENFEGFKGQKEKTLRNCHPSDDFLQSFGSARTSSKDQQGEDKSSSSNNSHISMQDKPNVGVVDPLSQLDPLWSIRR